MIKNGKFLLFGIFLLGLFMTFKFYDDSILRVMKHNRSPVITFPKHEGEDLIPFETLENPRFSERKTYRYRHQQEEQIDDVNRTRPKVSDDESLEEGSFLDDAWRDYKALCGKNWDSIEEEKVRRARWEEQYKEMENNNEENARFTEAQSCQMDMSEEEIKENYEGLHVPKYLQDQQYLQNSENFDHFQTLNVPQYVNWKPVLKLPVREQKCGDCWANAAETTLEGLYIITGNQYQQFSVQEDIDCALNKKSGCNGGFMQYAYEYSRKYGSTKYSDQPYVGSFDSNDQCNNDPKYKSNNVQFVSGYGSANNCDALKAAVAQQPVAAAIEATDSFMRTTSSIYKGDIQTSVNHAVTIIGYTPEYWIIQNSWGTLSHYNGYVRLAMGNTLGICTLPQWPKSNLAYTLKPKTDVINFENDFGTGSSSNSGTKGGQVVGTKFSVSWQTTSNPKTTNKKGESFVTLSNSYYYVPEGRVKTDFNFQQISFTFINQSGSSFEFIFEPKNGALVSNNVDGFTMTQCTVNGPDSICQQSSVAQYKDKIFLIQKDSIYILLYWYKP